VLGDEHPDTLGSAAELATDLRQLGEDRLAAEMERFSRAHRRDVPPEPT